MKRRSFLKRIALTPIIASPIWVAANGIAAQSKSLEKENEISEEKQSNAKVRGKFCKLFLKGGVDAAVLMPPLGFPKRHKEIQAKLGDAKGSLLSLRDVDNFAFHPIMKNLQRAFSEGGVQIYYGTGTGVESFSHFEQVDLVDYARGGNKEGYLSKVLYELSWNALEAAAFCLSSSMEGSLKGPFLSFMGTDIFDLSSKNLKLLSYLSSRDLGFFSDKCKSLVKGSSLYELCHSSKLAKANSNEIEAIGLEYSKRKKDSYGSSLATYGNAAAAFFDSSVKSPIMVVSDGGWDTHVNQIVELNKKLKQLDEFIGAVYFGSLKKNNGQSNSVAIVSEFGRGQTINSGNGTEHGIGGISLLLANPNSLPKKKIVFEDFDALFSGEFIPTQTSVFQVLRDGLSIPFDLDHASYKRIFSGYA